MNAEHEKLKDILAAAVGLGTPEERAAYLDTACQGDAPLRAKVERLLRAHTLAADDFLDHPVLPPLGKPAGEGPGSVIGRYKLLEEIGEGSFGQVFMAAQTEPVHRKVALKIIKAGMDTREVIARFEAERQALALMDHPNIAMVLDAGATDSGRPYFVMELVKGIPITDYCDQAKLPMEARLRLFMKLCRAVQHAHQKAVIHRDLKPSNILVTVIDGEPVPKIIDFGIAKALGQQLTERTLFTAFQQVIGTPAYMSPEQAALSGADVDTRSDIYSLGVLLYELLTGVTPLDAGILREAALDEIRRMIRETEPPKPSTRLRAMGPQLNLVAQLRQTEPSTLSHAVHGDLDWIVMKALEKDRGRRYESVGALEQDLRHHLKHEPVLAGPPGALYRMRKFVRRNRKAVTIAVMMVLLLVSGTIVSVWQAVRAEKAMAREAERAAIARIRLTVIEAQCLARTNPHEALLIVRELPADADRDTAARALDVAHLALQASPSTTERRLLGHTGPVKVAAWSPDGRRIVTASYDGTARVWNMDASEDPIILAGHRGKLWRAAWSPDGKRIVTTSADGTARVWNADGSGQPVVLAGHAGSVGLCAWSPDGKAIVTASTNSTARVWNSDGHGDPIVLAGHAGTVTSVAWSPDGKRIVTASRDKTARVWNADGRGAPVVLSGHTVHLRCAAWSPDGRRILTASWDKTVRVWDADGSGEPTVLHGRVECATWSPDGHHIAAADNYGNVRVWSSDGEGQPILLKGPAGVTGCYECDWSPDGKRIVTAFQNSTARVWNADGTGSPFDLTGHTAQVVSATWSPDGGRIVTASLDGTARVWNAGQPDDPVPLRGLAEELLSCAAWSPDGRRILTATWGRMVQVWNSNSRGDPIILPGSVNYAAWSPDGTRILATSELGKLQVWNSDGSGKALVLRESGPPIYCAAWSPDGMRIVTAGNLGTAELWNANGTGSPVVLAGHEGVVRAAWSPCGKRIVTHSLDSTARVWNADSSGEPIILTGHTAGLISTAWSPDGQRIVTASYDTTARVWNADGTGEAIILAGHTEDVRSAAWNPDGQRIVTGSSDRTARIWNADGTGDPIVLSGHTARVVSAAWSRDGQRIVTVSLDNTARLWQAQGKGDALVFRKDGNGKGWFGELSPDGKRILTATSGPTAWVWTIRTWPEMRALLWQRTSDILTPEERIRHLGETPEEASLGSSHDKISSRRNMPDQRHFEATGAL